MIFSITYTLKGACRAHLVQALCYKLEGQWFDSPWYHGSFFFFRARQLMPQMHLSLRLIVQP